MGNIVVQVGDHTWTTQAVHLASALARNTGSHVVLLYLALARNPGLLGSALAVDLPSPEEYKRLHEYSTICEDYGVDAVFQPMQYISLPDALCDAAEQLNASAMFAKRPDSAFTWWNSLRTWWLARAFRRNGCQLFLIDESTRMIDWMPDHEKHENAMPAPQVDEVPS